MQTVVKKLGELGIDQLANMKVKTFTDLTKEQELLVPKINNFYKFRYKEIIELVSWFNSPTAPIYLYGPSGTGKTSLIKELCARLNKPLIELTCSSKLEASDLLGTYVLGKADVSDKEPSMLWQDGALVRAMRSGALLLLNEYDLADPSQMSALNGVLEDGRIVLESHGCEVVEAQPGFSVVVTANTNGAGDNTGRYIGCAELNQAQLDRFLFVKVDYMSAEDERELLNRWSQGRIYPDFIERLVDQANELRYQFVEGTINVPVTTRKLIHFLERMCLFYGSPLGESEVLEMCISECFALRGADDAITGGIKESFMQRMSGIDIFNPNPQGVKVA